MTMGLGSVKVDEVVEIRNEIIQLEMDSNIKATLRVSGMLCYAML